MWFALLWFAAPIFASRDQAIDSASRLRDTLILGVAIPGFLAFADVLYWWSAIAIGLVIAGVRIARRPPRLKPLATLRCRDAFSWCALPILGVVACSWPLLVRPLLDGDSLSYHLPNAAAWVHAHSVWVTNTRYWWYPGGSELFAAGVFAVAGPFGLPACGTVTLLLLGQRAYAFGLRASLSPIAAAATSTLLVTAHAFALQSGNLENDVWLSAFLLEMLWCLRYERDAFARRAAVCALIKPVGFVFAGIVSIAGRARLRSVAIALLGFFVWALRDLVLFPSAEIPLSASAFGHPEHTTIIAHGFDGAATLLRAILADGFGFSLLALALLITLAARSDRTVRMCALASTVLFLIEPFGFNNAVPQLATGQSLRYFLPAIMFGTIGTLPFLRRADKWLGFVLFVCAFAEARRFENIFNADSATRGAAVILILTTIVFLIPNARLRRAGSGILALALLAYAGRIAGIHPAGYYDDALSSPGGTSSPFAWLRDAQPARIVAWSFSSGAIDIVSPHTEVVEWFGDDACALARRTGSWLMTIDDGSVFPQFRALTRTCGRAVFESHAALVVRP